MADLSKYELTAALRAASAAHHDYESVTLKRQRDEHWAGWYAAYVLGRLGDFATPSRLTAWLEAAAGEDRAASATDAVLSHLD